jgi:hypothetical protein
MMMMMKRNEAGKLNQKKQPLMVQRAGTYNRDHQSTKNSERVSFFCLAKGEGHGGSNV